MHVDRKRGYIEQTVNIHLFSLLPRKGLAQCKSKVSKIQVALAATIESRDDSELPEIAIFVRPRPRPRPLCLLYIFPFSFSFSPSLLTFLLPRGSCKLTKCMAKATFLYKLLTQSFQPCLRERLIITLSLFLKKNWFQIFVLTWATALFCDAIFCTIHQTAPFINHLHHSSKACEFFRLPVFDCPHKLQPEALEWLRAEAAKQFGAEAP